MFSRVNAEFLQISNLAMNRGAAASFDFTGYQLKKREKTGIKYGDSLKTGMRHNHIINGAVFGP